MILRVYSDAEFGLVNSLARKESDVGEARTHALCRVGLNSLLGVLRRRITSGLTHSVAGIIRRHEQDEGHGDRQMPNQDSTHALQRDLLGKRALPLVQRHSMPILQITWVAKC